MATWSLCLVSTSSSSTSGSTRRVVNVNPATDKVSDLFRIAGDAFGTKIEVLKSGFPPQSLDAEDGTLLSQCKKVGNQEKITVVLSDNKDGKSNNKKVTKKTSGKAASPPATRRPKRAAAQAATDSFAGVIREQDRLMKAEKQPNSKKAKKSAVLGSSNIKSKPKLKRAPAFTSKEPGRRLGDGAVISSPSNKKSTTASTRARGGGNKTTNKLVPGDQEKKYSDMSMALLESLNQSGTGGKILRKTMKSAVENTYESSKAVARLAALESRNPHDSVQMNRRTDDNKLMVRFQKGVQGRGYYEEVVDWIPTEVLKEVLRAILKSNAENLRPQNLALLSPRFLWALAYRHWEQQESKQKDQDIPTTWEAFSVEDAFKMLLPDHKDWSFLRRRKQTLSAKAMENLRQQKEAEEGSEGEENLEEAAEAIQHVEDAMDHLVTYDKAERAKRIANAALARQLKQQQESSGDWKIVTPTEYDEEELMECIAASQIPLKQSNDANKIAKVLVALDDAVHNWRELANHEPQRLRTQLTSKETSLSYVSEEQVSQWIDHARMQTLEEIMVEICDGSTSHVQLLRDKTPTNTPKDLAAWKAMPDFLLDELGEAAAGKVTVEDLGRFCNRACLALEQFEWLSWYATPVE